MSILNGLSVDVARKLAADQETLIRECITERIGSDWSVDSIVPRLRWEIDKSKPEKLLTLDGEPLLAIWPPESSTIVYGEKTEMSFTVQYRKMP